MDVELEETGASNLHVTSKQNKFVFSTLSLRNSSSFCETHGILLNIRMLLRSLFATQRLRTPFPTFFVRSVASGSNGHNQAIIDMLNQRTLGRLSITSRY